MSDSLRPHESQHARPPCPSPTPGVHSDSCPSSQWCHPAISSSVIPFSSCPQSLPASGSFPMSQLFAWEICFKKAQLEIFHIIYIWFGWILFSELQGLFFFLMFLREYVSSTFITLILFSFKFMCPLLVGIRLKLHWLILSFYDIQLPNLSRYMSLKNMY